MIQTPYQTAGRVFWIVDGGSAHHRNTFPARLSGMYANAVAVSLPVHASWLNQIVQLKALYEPRLDAMLQALEAHLADLATWRRPDGGFFVGLTLNTDIRAEELLEKGREANLALTDGRGFFADGQGDRFVRLPFCALTPDEVEAGIARLAEVVRGL